MTLHSKPSYIWYTLQQLITPPGPMTLESDSTGILFAQPTSALCPWCGTYYKQRPQGNCSNCGGPLSQPAGPERGPAPPAAPRILPKTYRRKILFLTGWKFRIGVLLILTNLPFQFHINGLDILLISIGGYLCWMGYSKGRKKLDVLEHGFIAEGKITEARQNEKIEVNEKHPFIITYSYIRNGQVLTGKMNCWDETSLMHFAGEPVWVVYHSLDFENNSSIWPPLA
jgi:hypothetical protein